MFNLTDKDKKLLIVLLLFVIAAIYYIFYQNMSSKIDELRNKNIELVNREEQLNQAVILYNQYKDKMDEIKMNYYNISNKIPTNLDEKFCIVDAIKLLRKYNSKIGDLPISQRQKQEINLDSKKLDKAYFYKLNINTEMTYDSFKKMLKESQSFESLFRINNVTISPIINFNNLAVSFELQFYGYEDNLAPLRQWEDFNLPTGKGNIFASSNATSVQSLFSKAYITENMDFIVLASTVNSPTTVLSMSKIGNGFSIKGENKLVENGKIHIKQKDNKLFYRISTTAEAYPKDNSFKEFESKTDEIIIYVSSSPRKYLDDNNVVVLDVKNETEKRVLVFIYNDDKNNPRVRIISSGKNAYVERR
jgi:type IV pilus assembly protein PilO